MISFSNSNLFGRGRKIQIELEKEEEEYQTELFEYTEPDVLSLPLNLNFLLGLEGLIVGTKLTKGK